MGDAEKESTEAPNFDSRLAQLERIVADLEEGGLELEPAIERYKEGVQLLKGCREILGGYKQQVEELTRDAEASLQPYGTDPDLRASGEPPG